MLAERELQQQLEQLRRDRDQELELQKRIRRKVAGVAASYRRCQVELSKTLIDVSIFVIGSGAVR